MSASSPTSPLCFTSNSNGSTNMQEVVSPVNPITQSPVTPMLDRSRPHDNSHSSQPTKPPTPMPLNTEWEAMVVQTSTQL